MLTSDELHDGLMVSDDGAPRLSGPGLAHLGQLRAALADYRETADPSAIEHGLVAARALVTTSPSGSDRPHLDELRRLTVSVPEFGELLTLAADEAGRAVAAGYDRLWQTVGLHGAAPRWNEAEREAARMVFACACGPAPAEGQQWLQASLRRVAATRLAELITDDLCRVEAVWETALGDHYASVRHRCAPRTKRRSRGLAEMLAGDAECRRAVTVRLERWVAAGGHPHELPGELEAAVVHARTPSRLA